MFAKKIDYCANETSYVALLEITKKKGGIPIKFVLYRYRTGGIFESIEFAGNERRAAAKAFPFGPIIYKPIEEELEGLQVLMEEGGLPRTRINPWKRTTGWLEDIAMGGAYNQYPKGVWVKIGKPNPCRQRHARRKKRLHFGEYGHILAKRRLEVEEIEKELFIIKNKNGYFEELEEEKQEELDGAEAKVDCLLAEMKYVRDQKFSHTVTP